MLILVLMKQVNEKFLQKKIPVVESQLRQAMTDDETYFSATERPTQHSLTMTVPTVGSVYKFTIISLTNSVGRPTHKC